MKLRILLTGFCIILAVFIAFWATIPSDIYADPELNKSDRNRISFGTCFKEISVANTVYEIVTAQTNKSYVVDYIIASATATGDIYLSEGTAKIFPEIALTESAPFISPKLNIRFSDGEGIDVNTTVNGSTRFWLEYHTE